CINGTTFADPNCITNATISGGATVALVPADYSASTSNPNFPPGADIIGVKFNVTGGPALPVTISFDSDPAPVYGDFYMKVANNKTAFNNGLGFETTSTLLSDFIARPDGSSGAAPEPGAAFLALAGIALVGLRKILASRCP